jgi:hypothetical protein
LIELYLALTRNRPDNKKANPLRLAFFLQINDLPEFYVERAMRIEPTVQLIGRIVLSWAARPEMHQTGEQESKRPTGWLA